MPDQDGATTPLAPGIRKITKADREAIVSLMCRAFDDDPFINYLVKQDARRTERMARFMDTGLMRLTFPYGETYVTEAGDGAALWNPPGGRPHGMLADLSMLPMLVRVSGLGNLTRSIGAFSRAEKLHPHEPHYYLLGIGVDPERQGRGIGSSLIAPMAERCDREGIGAYLESSKERNVPLYERFGFQVREVVEFKDGPSVWTMWRDPK